MLALRTVISREMNVDLTRAFRETRNKRALRKLLCNQRNGWYKHCGRCFYYRAQGNGAWKPQHGLLPSLEQAFWADFDFKKAKRAAKREAKKRGIVKPKRAGHGNGRHYGSIGGTEVHEQLKDWVELDPTAFRKRNPRMHAYTKQLLAFIAAQQWEPLLAEFKLGAEPLRIATACDLVCKSKEDKLIFLEIKTGYEDYFKAASHDRACHSRSRCSHWGRRMTDQDCPRDTST